VAVGSSRLIDIDAAIEAEWDTAPAPAGFTLFGLPDVKDRKTYAEVKIPWLLIMHGAT
jgi:cytochrome bd ubiquinol oxidase subunit I